MTGSSNDDLSKRLGADLARLRRIHASMSQVAAARSESVMLTEPRERERSDASVQADSPTTALTELERRGLFAALAAGTERHLGRKPIASEFVRLCDAVAMARQIVALERGLLSADLEIHWTGRVVRP